MVACSNVKTGQKGEDDLLAVYIQECLALYRHNKAIEAELKNKAEEAKKAEELSPAEEEKEGDKKKAKKPKKGKELPT